MKQKSTFLMMCLAICLTQSTLADECAKFKPMAKKHLSDHHDLAGFYCGKDIDSKLIEATKIKGFKLIAIQPGYVTDSSGTAIYQGDRVFEGTISYTDEINDGFFFDAKLDQNIYKSFSVGGESSEEDFAKLKYPMNTRCKEGEELMAKAKVRIKLFQDTVAESCQGGTYPLEYEIINIGKYACKKVH